MKFTLKSLSVSLKGGDEDIGFEGFSYFYGQMGAGKTTIAKLIDYCLGGDLDLSPALQSEFVGATLAVELAKVTVTIERPRDAGRAIARWDGSAGPFQVSIPVRDADGEVIPDSGVQTLSDLVFWLSGATPPRVRRSKTRDDSDLERLSLRDLLWYCYLDQDTIDSDFFHLGEDANNFKRLKSRDVLRLVIGFHEQRVAQLEAALDRLRDRRQDLNASIKGMIRALEEFGVESDTDLSIRVTETQAKIDAIGRELALARERAAQQTVHAADTLREEARTLGSRIASLEDAVIDVERAKEDDERHLHEIETLRLKFRRSVSAKAVLTGVAFASCPRCAQSLPTREPGICNVCGQNENIEAADPNEIALLERDAKSRIDELRDIIGKHVEKSVTLRRAIQRFATEKSRVEGERNTALSRYDSAYLSTIVSKEREQSALVEQLEGLGTLSRFPRLLTGFRKELEQLVGEESGLRAELRQARESAERDSASLDKLKTLFLDCLLRAGVPGIRDNDRVEMRTTNFLPEVHGPEALDATVTSFANMSSGGKKTLFKCCFAVAVHRLAMEVGGLLPEFLIIDSPMKNISERENREQFEGFHQLLYDLKATEFHDTQIIMIDKEYCAPPVTATVSENARHMTPDNDEFPPLISYYRGH
jgi:hypothetical protein